MTHEMIRAASPRPHARPHACISSRNGRHFCLDRKGQLFLFRHHSPNRSIGGFTLPPRRTVYIWSYGVGRVLYIPTLATCSNGLPTPFLHFCSFDAQVEVFGPSFFFFLLFFSFLFLFSQAPESEPNLDNVSVLRFLGFLFGIVHERILHVVHSSND